MTSHSFAALPTTIESHQPKPEPTSSPFHWLRSKMQFFKPRHVRNDVEVLEVRSESSIPPLSPASRHASIEMKKPPEPQMQTIVHPNYFLKRSGPSNINLNDMFDPPEEKMQDQGESAAAADDDDSGSDEDNESEEDEFLSPSFLSPKKRKSSQQITEQMRSLIGSAPAYQRQVNVDPRPSLQSYISVMEKLPARPGVAELLVEKHPFLMENPLYHVQERPETVQNSLNTKAVFGMWDGVVSRCLMQIFGGIMFLRLGQVFGQAGILAGWGVILSCLLLTLITSLSLAAIATNGIPHEGGTYFLISRSLGPQFGGLIGILLAFSATVEVSIYVIAFAEALLAHIQESNPGWTLLGDWDPQLFGLSVFFLLVLLVLNGIQMVVKTQVSFLVVLSISLISIFLGAFLSPANPTLGIKGFSWRLFQSNLNPDFSQDTNFAYMLTVFFPAMTGFTAATTIYGRIRNPAKSLPRGTLISLAISSTLYLFTGFIIGSSVERDVNGKEGLKFRPTIMTDLAIVPALVYMGIYASTLSSALASMVVAPRILLALMKDDLFPIFNTLFKHFKNFRRELMGPLLVTMTISIGGILIGSVDGVAPIITGAHILSYLMINYACFATSISGNPGWRPTFHFYSPWIALFGCVLCLVGIFFMHAIAASIFIIVGFGLYKYLGTTTKDIQWGSTADAITFTAALSSLRRLNKLSTSITTYRPNILVFCGELSARRGLVEFSKLLKKGHGLLMFGNVTIYDPLETQDRRAAIESMLEYKCSRNSMIEHLRVSGNPGFAQNVFARSLPEGVLALAQTSGISHLRANTAVFGFRECWCRNVGKCEEYVRMLQDMFALDLGVLVVRNPDAFLATTKPDASDAETECIDVWWLFDDGGLTLLLAYLVSKSRRFRSCSLRLMTVVASKFGREAARMVGYELRTCSVFISYHIQRHSRFIFVICQCCDGWMDGLVCFSLLKQLRIKASIVAIPVTLDEHGEFQPSKKMVERFRRRSSNKKERLSHPTRRLLHIADLLHSHSTNSKIVFITIPIPGVCYKPSVFMAWLDCLSYDMPTTVMMRGNQQNVLSADL